MSELPPLSNRDKALNTAAYMLANGKIEATDLIPTAQSILEFLNDQIQPAQPQSSSESTTTVQPTTAATKKPRATKAASSSTQGASASPVGSSSTSTEASPAQPASAPAEQASPAAATGSTSPASNIPSLDDVRAALTQCQGRNNGDAAIPRGVLSKYSVSGTLDKLKEEDRAKVIAEVAKL